MDLLAGAWSWLLAIGPQLKQNHLWQHMVKHTAAVTVTIIIVIIPAVRQVYGAASYLAAMAAVFGHCARRFGQMAEALVLILAGMLLGTAWAIFGLYLSSLVWETHQPAAYTVRALFLVVGTIFHGYVRSHSPRLFILVWLFLLCSLQTLVGTANHVTVSTATQTLYPILTAMGVLLLVNVTVFPEFSGRFLADTTIQTLAQTQGTMKAAMEWFMEPSTTDEERAPTPSLDSYGTTAVQKAQSAKSAKSVKEAEASSESKLAALSGAKAKLRAKLGSCKSALKECMFEIEYAVIPSRSLKPVSSTTMTGLIRNVTTLISACESKYVMMSKASAKSEDETTSSSDSDSEDTGDAPDENGARSRLRAPWSAPASRRTSVASMESLVEHVKPQREIASGNPEVLNTLLSRVREPVKDLLAEVDAAIASVMACLAYCYDVQQLPSDLPSPKGLSLEEVDKRVDSFSDAITSFDKCFHEALGKVAEDEAANGEVDVMPRIETFLLSSSLLSLRHAAEQVTQMLKHARSLVGRSQARNNRKRLYWPRKINWQKWLRSGGEQDIMALPETARKEKRTGNEPSKKTNKTKEGGDDSDSEPERDAKKDEEANPSSNNKVSPRREHARTHSGGKPSQKDVEASPRWRSVMWWRTQIADMTDSVFHSEHIAYALKLTTAVFAITWIPFYGPFNSWFASMRGIWVPLQLVLTFEVAIGSSIDVFFVRAGGVVFGCVWGYASYEISRGQLPALVVILVPGILVSSYVQLGTSYVKAGMISIVSMSIVALATVSGPGPAWENFVKRLVCFLIGGTVALIVEVSIYPVKARERLVESLSATISHIARMEGAIATGSESPTPVTEFRAARINARFQKAKAKAQNSLSAAETFLPFCLKEPRLKGSFRTLEPVYKEIIYVLRQIIDRMDNNISLRQAYGSSILEELNPSVYMYRRNVASAITVTLFAVNEALTTKLPLPQFLPSSRLAQMRLVNRVRETIHNQQSSMGIHQPSLVGQVLGHTSAALMNLAARRRYNHNARNSYTASGHASGTSTPKYDRATIRSATQQKFLSWSAAAAGQYEIIEFLEELVDLTKLLVGVNAFRTGMLERPTYRNYAQKLRSLGERQREKAERAENGGSDGAADSTASRSLREEQESEAGWGGLSPVASAPTVMRRRRTASSGASKLHRTASVAERFRRKVMSNPERGEDGLYGDDMRHGEGVDELPPSLQRIGSRFGKQASLGKGE